MYLFGGEIGWMEKFGEKMERKTFLSVFGWVEMKENKGWNLSVFFPGPLKSFLPKMERKLKREIAQGLHPCCFSSHLFSCWTLLFIFYLAGIACLFFFSFFFFIYSAGLSIFFITFIYFIFWFRCDFFYGHNFYFLINLGDWFFFVVYHFFGFNWASFFNKGICVNL